MYLLKAFNTLLKIKHILLVMKFFKKEIISSMLINWEYLDLSFRKSKVDII